MAQTARLAVALAVVVFAADGARAGVFRNVVRGLEYSGFQFIGRENPLSGGAIFGLTRTFGGETLDFGSTELRLTGPIDFTFETGGRMLPVLDVSLNTRDQPLFYTLTADVGGQSTVIDGNVLLDATGSINTFGFYDFELQYSVRETITQDGRFGDEEEFVDFDIGPINVSGNVFADMLAVLFDPIFAATDSPNIFASFSGRLQAEEQLNRALADARTEAFSAHGFGESQAEQFLPEAQAGGASDPPLYTASSSLTLRDGGPDGQSLGVPDPPTIMLLLAAVPLLGSRRRRRAA